ncbi:hypothetical protein [Aestuariibius sp. HNIBRBA575]|uniref:hypothetical protein n=1 Tax=Aestuariibius sp. HNIBRBA575 TaxID=3233343 RepID=UPI0034A1F6A7
MKPNFALSLSFEGIRLLQRAPEGWLLFGEVGLESPDLDADLAAVHMRAMSAAKSQGDDTLYTRLILPNDQIKYLALDTTRADENDVRHALDGATPYAVDELVYDFVHGGGRTYIAAVARETLAEAEAFAMAHHMAPVAFAAIPEPFTFSGEAFFGATQFASTMGDGAITIAREDSAIEVVGAAPQELPAIEDDTDHTSPPTDADSNVVAIQDADDASHMDDTPADSTLTDFDALNELALAASLPHEEQAAAPQYAETDPDETADEVADQPQEDDQKDDTGDLQDEEADMPVFVPRPRLSATPTVPSNDAAPTVSLPDVSAPDISAPEVSGPEVSAAEVTGPPADAAPDDVAAPQPVFGSRRDPSLVAQRDGASQANTAPPAEKPARKKNKKPNIERREPSVTAPVLSPITEGNAPAISGDAAAVDAGISAPLGDTPNLGPATNAPDMPAHAAPVTGVSETAVDPIVAAPTLSADMAESLSATLQPTETEPQSTVSTSKAAGLATGLVSSAGSALSGAGSLFRSRRKPNKGQTTDPNPAAQPAAKSSIFGARKSAKPAKVVGGKPRFLGLILTVILILFLATMAALAALSEEGFAYWFGGRNNAEPVVASLGVDTPNEAAPQATSAPETASASATIQTLASPTPPIGQVLSPSEAQRIYAATGVWQRAPRIPLIPRDESISDLGTSDLDRQITTQTTPTFMPSVAASTTDFALATVMSPPPPGTRYARDARGFILATPEGTRTPDGALIFAGSPAVRPPEAFFQRAALAVTQAPTAQTAQPAPAETTAPDGAQTLAALPAVSPQSPSITPPILPEVTTATPPLSAAQAALAATRPLARPETIVAAATDAIAPAPTATATPQPNPELVRFRPQSRPATIVAAAPATPETVTPQNPELVAFRPRLRPSGIAPAPQTDPVIAEVPAEPSVETPPQEPARNAAADASLAAAIQGALTEANRPDPFANASAQAVAQSVRPDTRPRNFSRVVQQQQASAQRQAPQQPAVARPAPSSGPTPTSVASAATLDNAINLRRINLIGVYGSNSDRRALVRLSNGRYIKVSVGDRLDGGHVAAIGDTYITYTDRGRTTRLDMPAG